MEVDASRKAAPLPPVCFRCHKSGHVKADCPLRYDVRYMDLEEKEEAVQRLLAKKDAADMVNRVDEQADFL
jgi:hypothetical protein